MSFAVQVIRHQPRKGKTTVYDATTPEKAKSGWLRLFKKFKEDGTFKGLDEPFEHPVTTEKLSDMLKKVVGQMGKVEPIVPKQTYHREINGPEWTWPHEFILNADGHQIRVTVKTEKTPISDNSEVLAKFAKMKELFEAADGGDARAAMELCLEVHGVTIEAGIDPTEEKGK